MHDHGPAHVMTQTPAWHTPGQSAPHCGTGASAALVSSGGIPESTGGIHVSIGGIPVSRGGFLASTGGAPLSAVGASSPGDGKHRPARPVEEAHQPSEPQTWSGAHSEVALQRTAHSAYRGS